MNKLILSAVFAMGFLTVAMDAQARQLYWTGKSTGTTVAECHANAASDGDSGVRNSCVYDYQINETTCYSAPVVSTSRVALQQWGNSYYCEVRVDIYVP